MELASLIDSIKMYNEAYRRGEPQITDLEYDELIEELRKQDPENELLKKAIIENATERMEKLPYPMFSLEKIKSVQELFQWMQSCNLSREDRIVITPKFDGISLLVDEKSRKVFTRGDGIEGQRSDKHYELLAESKPISPALDFSFSFGEAIFPTKDFLENKGQYKSARNCVAGLFNSPDPSSMLIYAKMVRYGTDREVLDKDTQLSLLKSTYHNTTLWITTTYGSFLSKEETVKEWLGGIFNTLCDDYKCDGLVIEVNSSSQRKALGRLPNGNPKYAIAYKDPEWSERADTVVKEIEWNISKDGKAKPVIIFDPIDLCSATVQRATAYNAKYLVDSNICEGAIITIARSGDVIPKHLKTLSYNRGVFHDEMDDMMICPSCESILSWDNTATELICNNPLCREKQISRLVYFFQTLKTEEFDRPSIQKFYDAGCQSVSEILSISLEDMKTIPGIGDSLSKTLSHQFASCKKNGVCFAKLATAYNVFEGKLAEKTCQLILDNLSESELFLVACYESVSEASLISISGIGQETATAFNKGLEKMKGLDDYIIPISFWSKPKVKAAINQMAVCFSGIRDTEVEQWLESHGHKVVSGVSMKTTHLVMKTIGSGSSKETKASKLGVRVVTLEDFIKELTL